MIDIIGNSELTCRLTGERTHRREVGYCVTADGVDIGQAIIAAGAALACPRFDPRYLHHGRRQELNGLVRSLISNVVDVRDPIQIAYDQLAQRSEAMLV